MDCHGLPWRQKLVSATATAAEPDTGLFNLIVKITGWKNSLKGAGYFLGSLLLQWELGPNKAWGAIAVLALMVLIALPWPILRLSVQRTDHSP